jgi:Amt family ammonium transporter
MKVGLKWIVSFAIIALIAVGGLFWSPITDFPNTGAFLSEDKIVGADVAWILLRQVLFY